MDLPGLDEELFTAIAAQFCELAAPLGVRDITAIPLCARDGDNILAPSPRMPWYRGPSLLTHLETIRIAPPADADFRMQGQSVTRPAAEVRLYAGTIASGTIRPGEAVTIYAGATQFGRPAQIASIVT